MHFLPRSYVKLNANSISLLAGIYLAKGGRMATKNTFEFTLAGLLTLLLSVTCNANQTSLSTLEQST